METQLPKRSNVLMIHSPFYQDKGTQPLAKKEHPCVVLNTAQHNNLPEKPIMAVIIRMTYSKTSALKPNHLDAKPYHTRNPSIDKKQKLSLYR